MARHKARLSREAAEKENDAWVLRRAAAVARRRGGVDMDGCVGELLRIARRLEVEARKALEERNATVS